MISDIKRSRVGTAAAAAFLGRADTSARPAQSAERRAQSSELIERERERETHRDRERHRERQRELKVLV